MGIYNSLDGKFGNDHWIIEKFVLIEEGKKYNCVKV